MPTFKKVKGTKKLFIDNQLHLALKSILKNRISLRKAAKEYCIPRSTLADYVKQKNLSLGNRFKAFYDNKAGFKTRPSAKFKRGQQVTYSTF